jgi:hypothetical protein
MTSVMLRISLSLLRYLRSISMKILLASGACLFICPWTFADGFCNAFCGARDQLVAYPLTPLNQLSDEDLFLAAEALRENRMPAVQRQLNLLWLDESPETTIQGSRVWSKMLHYSLSRYNFMRDNSSLYSKALNYLDESEFDDAGYQFKISSHSVKLVFNYSF